MQDLIAAVVASAVVPTLIADAFFMPRPVAHEEVHPGAATGSEPT